MKVGVVDKLGDALVAEVLVALDQGIELEGYLEVRGLGASHLEVLGVTDGGIDLGIVAACLRAGASCAEVLSVRMWVDNGRDIGMYLYARENGLAHADVMGVLRSGVSLNSYVLARVEGGATHQEAADPLVSQCESYSYTRCRRAGINHSDVVEAVKADVYLGVYCSGREAGLSHEQLLGAARSARDMRPTKAVQKYLATAGVDLDSEGGEW